MNNLGDQIMNLTNHRGVKDPKHTHDMYLYETKRFLLKKYQPGKTVESADFSLEFYSSFKKHLNMLF